MAELNSELPDALDQAIRVRTAWERAEEAKRVKNLVNERKTTSSREGEAMGFTSRVSEMEVDEEQRIIVSMERFAPSSSENPTKAVLASVSTVALILLNFESI